MLPFGSPAAKVLNIMYKSREKNNETYLNLFSFGVSCDLVVPLAEFEVEVLFLEKLATGGPR